MHYEQIIKKKASKPLSSQTKAKKRKKKFQTLEILHFFFFFLILTIFIDMILEISKHSAESDFPTKMIKEPKGQKRKAEESNLVKHIGRRNEHLYM